MSLKVCWHSRPSVLRLCLAHWLSQVGLADGGGDIAEAQHLTLHTRALQRESAPDPASGTAAKESSWMAARRSLTA